MGLSRHRGSLYGAVINESVEFFYLKDSATRFHRVKVVLTSNYMKISVDFDWVINHSCRSVAAIYIEDMPGDPFALI